MKIGRWIFAVTLLALLPEAGWTQKKETKFHRGGMPAGKPMLWEDRGALTPSKVYWGPGSRADDPTSRLPAPPFSHLEPDDKPGTVSPKAKAQDSNKVKWTVKFSPPTDSEVHAEVAATRLAWALGFGVDEDYYVGSGKFENYAPDKKMGKAFPYIQPDGSFREARFKRHNKDEKAIQDAKGKDMNWDEARNPGVPPEQLSGLLLFDVMTHNFDAQAKNCKIVHKDGPNGPENWYIMSDMGASFGGGRSKGNLKAYLAEKSYIQQVKDDYVYLSFFDIIKSRAGIHKKIPLAHAQWFRKQLEKLTDDEIRAAFNASYATEELNKAYAAGNLEEAKRLTSPDAAAYAAKFREKIEEFKSKVPPGS